MTNKSLRQQSAQRLNFRPLLQVVLILLGFVICFFCLSGGYTYGAQGFDFTRAKLPNLTVPLKDPAHAP